MACITIFNPSPTAVPLHHSRGNPKMSLPSTDPLTTAGRFLWGRSLPPQPLITAVRTTWSTVWHLMMRQLAPSSSTGSYSRPAGSFPSIDLALYPPTASLHLYAALSCPWAHRTLIVRAIKSLEPFLPVSIAAPGPDGPWEFPSSSVHAGDLVPGPDRANGRRTLRDVYGMRRGGYDGRSTVPMLWDVDKRDVACNESYEIIKFLNSWQRNADNNDIDLYPSQLQKEIEEWNRIIYPSVNNGVYRCGFAQSQEAYDEAVNALFDTLDTLESHLGTNRYLCGDVLTLADVCLFTTLIRFDLVYYVLFKCTKKKLVEYPNLHSYTRDIYQIPKVAETCNFEAIMDGYFRTLFPLNPGGIRPALPSACKPDVLSKPHGRDSVCSNGLTSFLVLSRGQSMQ
ncbi:putative glutathione S-transferase protein [Dioscorea alata]|uniref:Glutathione S-transferase protein n=1 Tax=Dioscorea alata TaxID=55571 RepID=A0ACB7V8H4_DIOAL|nr:putative glutathione S-transferase protein [Dioscorea alata]